jgi:hypothetical protein
MQKKSMHVKIVLAIGTYLPKKYDHQFFVLAENLIAVELLTSINVNIKHRNDGNVPNA